MRKILFLFILITYLNMYILTDNTQKNKNFLICNKSNCPRGQGVCAIDNKCLCVGDYMTHTDFEKFGNTQCNYLKRNQAKVFIMEFIFGFGAGHFYLGNYILALIKFCYTFCTVVIVSIYPCLQTNKKVVGVYKYVMGFFAIGYIIWQCIDGYLIAKSIYKDSNGIEMNSAWDVQE